MEDKALRVLQALRIATLSTTNAVMLRMQSGSDCTPSTDSEKRMVGITLSTDCCTSSTKRKRLLCYEFYEYKEEEPIVAVMFVLILL